MCASVHSYTHKQTCTHTPARVFVFVCACMLARARVCVCVCVRATFVEPKTSPSPGLSSPSQDPVQIGSSPSPIESKQRKKKIIFFKTTYLIIDNVCDTRDSISYILS